MRFDSSRRCHYYKVIIISTIKTRLECPACNNLFSARGGNYKRHIASCDGLYLPSVKLTCCKYCKLPFLESMSASSRANHSRWCCENPKRESYNKTNNGSQLRTPAAVEKRRAMISKAHADGKYKNAQLKTVETKRIRGNLGHSEETKQLMREKALASPHRRLKRKMIEYNGIWLDSTWELELAKRLDELKIKWIRPDPIPWIDDKEVTHNYFPDFYLPNHDIFLDPKNPYARKVQKKKLKMLLTQYSNIVIICTLEECKNYII